jgi:hypothetical protein
MPNDAKFGLVVGVSLVIVVAVFFFRKEAPALDPAAATIIKPAAESVSPSLPVSNSRTVRAKAMSNTPQGDPIGEPTGREVDHGSH